MIHDPARVGDLDNVDNLALRGVLERIHAPATVWVLLVAASLALAVVALHRHRSLGPVELLGIPAALMMLISPVSWVHHDVWWPVVALTSQPR